MKIFWISFSVFFFIASLIGIVSIVYWIFEAVKQKRNYNKVKVTEEETTSSKKGHRSRELYNSQDKNQHSEDNK